MNEDVEETDQTTSDGGRGELGEVDGDDKGQETDGETSEETTKDEDGLRGTDRGNRSQLTFYRYIEQSQELILTTEPLANVWAKALAIKMMFEKMTDHFLPYFSVKGN